MSMMNQVQKTVEMPRVQFIDRVVNLGNECGRIKTCALGGRILHLIPIRSVRHVTTLVTFWKFYVMLEQHVCLLHNAWSEASDLFHTVSLCGLSRFRPCFLVGSLICCLA